MNGRLKSRATYALVAAILIFVAATLFWHGQRVGKMADAIQSPRPAAQVELSRDVRDVDVPIVLEPKVGTVPELKPNDYGFLLFAPEIEAAMLGEAHSRQLRSSPSMIPRMTPKTEFAPSTPSLIVEPVK